MRGDPSVEDILYKIVHEVLENNGIRDKEGFYKKIVYSIWNKENLADVYAKYVPPKKSGTIWGAITQRIDECGVLKDTKYEIVLKEVSVIMRQCQILDADNYYQQVADKIIAGNTDEIVSELTTKGSGFTVALFRNNLVLSELITVKLSPQQQLVEKIVELLEPYPVDDQEVLANLLATSLITGKPTLESTLEQDVSDNDMQELIPKLQHLLISLHINPTASSASVDAFKQCILPNKYTLGDFHKVEECALQKSSILQMVGTICDKFPDPSHLFSVLFYLIKRSQGLSPLATTLKQQFIYRKIENSQYSLRFFVNALLINCVPFLRQKLIELLAASNPVPLDEINLNGNDFSLALIPEPYWIFNDKLTLFSYAIDTCKGKSSLLNQIFGTNFEQSNSTQYFQGTVDMQSDKMFIRPRDITLLDSHGILNKQHKYALMRVADGVVIHTSEQLWKESKQLCSEIDSLAPYNLKFILVVVRDVAAFSDQMTNDAFENEKLISNLHVNDGLQKILHVFRLPNTKASDLADFYASAARPKIWEALRPCIQDGHIRKNKKEIFRDQLPETLRNSITTIENAVLPLVTLINEAMSKSCTSIFKIYPTFLEMRRCHNDLTRTRDLDNAKYNKLLSKLHKFNTTIREISPLDVWPATAAFESLIYSELNVPMIYRLVNQIKSINSLATVEVRNRLLELKNSLPKEPTQEQRDEIHKLTDKLESLTVSVEIFWREVNQYFILGRDYDKLFSQLVSFTKNAHPFEIVDGDNYYFPHAFLSKAFSHFDKSRILVIGIIGPQNSGKSTLLNFMFGCVFTASDGRTTKGVYGSLIQSPTKEYDYVLLLDTEGIHSVEKNDPEYDRKVVLFTLAVCDVVIINVKDEISDSMRKTLDICAASLVILKNSKMPRPVVFFVQNQKADVQNIQHSAMHSILEGLQQQGLREILTLSSDMFVALPSAFNTKDITVHETLKWRNLETSADFIEAVTDFTTKLFKHAEIRRKEVGLKMPFLDLPGWIDFAHNVFVTVAKYEDLTLFADITERNLNEELLKWQQEKNESILSNACQDKLKTPEDIIAYISRHLDVLSIELESMCQQKKVPQHLFQRHANRLTRVFTTAKSTWICDAQIQNEKDKLGWEVANGAALINKRISEILSEGKGKYTKEELMEEFNNVFNKCLDDLNAMKIKLEQANKEACLSQIETYSLYQSLSRDISTQITTGDLPTKLIDEMARELVEKNADGIIYRNTTMLITSPDIRLLTDYKWQFFRQLAMQTLVNSAKKIASPGKDLPDDFCTKILHQTKNLNNTGVQIWEKLSFLPSQKPIQHEIWAMALTERIAKDLFTKNIDVFIDMMVPFHAARNLAQHSASYSFSSEIAQRAVANLNQVIAFCNAELEAFGACLTTNIILDIHAFMCQLLISANLQLHSSNLKKLVTDFQNKQRNYEENFLAQTYQGPDMDERSIKLVVKEFKSKITEICLTVAKQIFKARVENFESTNTCRILKTIIEENLCKQSPQDQIKYVKNPADTLRNQFRHNWNIFWKSTQNIIQKIYQDVAESIGVLAAWVNSIETALKQTGSRDFFEAPSHTPSEASLNAKQCAAVLLLKDLLKQEDLPTEYTSAFVKLTLCKKITPLGTKPVLVIPSLLNSDLLQLLLDQFANTQSISNLVNFVAQLNSKLLTIAKKITAITISQADLDTTKLFDAVESRAVGCTAMCPCCLRSCDVSHWKLPAIAIGTFENKHRCIGGHQYRGMAGYSLKGKKWASLRICTDIKDTDKIEIENKLMTWSDFKNRYTSWDFTLGSNLTLEQLTASQARMLVQWEHIGRTLCDGYNIVFTQKDYHGVELETHFIFVLDSSKSMSGAPWKALLEAIRSFIKFKTNASSLAHTMSCVVFDSDATVQVLKYPLELNIVDNLQFNSGNRTRFSVALKQVINVLKKCTDYSVNVIIFMTDGKGIYPKAELAKLNKWKYACKIDTFWGVGIAKGGAVDGTLKRMTDRMGERGQYRNPSDLNGLITEYVEIAKLH